MLAKLFRFHGHSAVRRSYKQGSSVRGPLCSMHYSTGIKITNLKVAVVVSKKVSKSAVVRNRIRRRIYEVVRIMQPDLLRPAELIFTIYQAEVADIPSLKLQKEVRELLKRAKLIP